MYQHIWKNAPSLQTFFVKPDIDIMSMLYSYRTATITILDTTCIDIHMQYVYIFGLSKP